MSELQLSACTYIFLCCYAVYRSSQGDNLLCLLFTIFFSCKFATLCSLWTAGKSPGKSPDVLDITGDDDMLCGSNVDILGSADVIDIDNFCQAGRAHVPVCMI